MDPTLPPTPISPHIPLPAVSTSQAAQAQPANFDPSSYPIPSSPNDGDESDDGDLFPGTAHAIERSSNPALVPLPPSPKVKAALPHRRSKGWVSSYPDNAPDINASPGSAASDRVHSGPQGGSRSSRRVSARLPSGPTPLKIGGRTISGVMQYAIRPPSPSPPASPPHSTPSPPSTNTDGLREDGSSESPPLSRADKLHMTPISTPLPTSVPDADMADDDVSDIDDIDDGGEGVDEEPYNLDEIRSSVVGLTDQANDEVWMSFVRQQLGTLFPDFFQPDADDPATLDGPNESAGFGSLDGRVPGQSGEGSDGWEMVQDGAHHRPMTMMRQGEYGSVPNVREEISGLREEIERLRGVVGGLASGLFDSGMIRAGEGDQVAAEGPLALAEEPEHAEKTTVSLDEAEREDEDEIDDELGLCEHEDSEIGTNSPKSPQEGKCPTEDGPPEVFLQTASISASLIRSLTHKLDAEAGIGTPSDEEVFSAENLARLQNRLLELVEKA